MKAWAAVVLLAATATTATCATAGQVVRVQQDGLALRVETGRAGTRAGGRLTFELMLTNTTDRPLTLLFRDAQRFDVTLRDQGGREVWRWSEDRMFAQVLGEEVLAPGAERMWTATVPRVLPPGQYVATVAITATNTKVETTLAVPVR
jgi:hypothetical protein